MSRRLSTCRTSSPTPERTLSPVYFSARRHYHRSKPNAVVVVDSARSLRNVLAGAVIAVGVMVLFWLLLGREEENVVVGLRDQPDYDRLLGKRQCTATLCNTQGYCSEWYPQQHYPASALQEKQVYRDVKTIGVDLGCELLVKTAGEGGAWMTVTSGRTDCTASNCQDLVEMDLKGKETITGFDIKVLLTGKSR